MGSQDLLLSGVGTLIPARGALFYHHLMSLAQPQTLFVGPRQAVRGPMEDQSLSPAHCLSVFKGLSPLNPGVLGDE